MAELHFPERLNLCVELLDRNVKEGRGDRTALLYQDERYSYSEVLAQVCRAAGLLQELGLQREQRVLLMLSDHPEFVFFWLATLRLGCVVSHVNPDSKPEELAYYLEYTRSRILIAEERLLAGALELKAARFLAATVVCRGEGGGELEERSDDVPRDTQLRGLPERVVRWEDAGKSVSEWVEPEDTLAEDVGVMLYTSGSTGFPKAILHRHVDFLFSTERYGLPVLGLTPDDVTVAVPKLFFGYATGNNLIFPFRAGATIALFPEKSTPDRVLAEVTRRKATILTSVPTMLNGMCNLEAPAGRYDWSSLRLTTSAGEALPVELYRRYKERFGHEILDGIGSAELFHVYITNRPGDVTVGSLGRVVEGYEVRIRDDGGADLPDGELGSLWVKGESLGLGYFMRTEASRAVFRGDWFVSADKFRRDAEGRYYFGGRTDDLLKVGGRFLAPIELENVLVAHEAVAEVAVVGFEDAEGLVKPRAYVVVRAGHAASEALAQELKELCKQKLQPWKYPREIVFRDGLPKNDRGKVQRNLLRS